jgi:hypothetical protein
MHWLLTLSGGNQMKQGCQSLRLQSKCQRILSQEKSLGLDHLAWVDHPQNLEVWVWDEQASLNRKKVKVLTLLTKTITLTLPTQ